MELSKPSNGDENRSPWALVGDAHCHPQLDKDWKDLLSLSGRPIALMAVSFNDWSAVDSASELLPNSVRCFGIHPWWSQLHASDDVAPGECSTRQPRARPPCATPKALAVPRALLVLLSARSPSPSASLRSLRRQSGHVRG